MRVLIVGLGSIARKHIAALREIDPRSEFFALRSGFDASVLEGCTNVYDRDQAKLLDADFAIISNPTAKHVEAIEWLKELKIPLFIEKPLSDNLQIEEMVVDCADILTYVACNLRFLECLQWVKDRLQDRRVNEVNVYCGSYLPDWRQGVDWRTVYSANRAKGGGVHIDLIHEIDYVYWLFGKPRDVTKVFRNNSSLNIDAVDYANYCLIYDNFAVSVVLNYYRRDYKRTLEIVFDDQTWSIDLAKNCVSIGGVVVFDATTLVANTYVSQMRYFMGLVRHGEQVSCNTVSEAYKVLKICLEDDAQR